MRTGGKPLATSRLNIVGEGRAGKTCWLRAVSNKPFEDTTSTIGVKQSLLEVNKVDMETKCDGGWSVVEEGTLIMKADEAMARLAAEIAIREPPVPPPGGDHGVPDPVPHTQKPVYETKYRTVKVPKPIEYEEQQIPYQEVRQDSETQKPVYETKYRTVKVPKPIEYDEQQIPYQEVTNYVAQTIQEPVQVMVPQVFTEASPPGRTMYEVTLSRATGQFVGPDGG